MQGVYKKDKREKHNIKIRSRRNRFSTTLEDILFKIQFQHYSRLEGKANWKQPMFTQTEGWLNEELIKLHNGARLDGPAFNPRNGGRSRQNSVNSRPPWLTK